MLRLLLVAVLVALTVPLGRAQQGPGAVSFDPAQSLLVKPLLLTDEPPEARAAAHILVQFKGCIGASPDLERTPQEAEEIALGLRRRVVNGEDFATVARQASASRNAPRGGVMGTFAQGVLGGGLDDFLFSAEVGDVSEPMLTGAGYQVLTRVDRWAAARMILVSGRDDAARTKMGEILARLGDGEDFAAVAQAHSDDAATAPSGGALTIYERGPNDRLLKAATFALPLGGVSDVIETPLGLHLVKRVPVDELDESLRERNWARVRGIVLIQRETALEIPTSDRSSAQTLALAEELAARHRSGESFAELAAQYNEDFADGRARAGDLGWVHRRQPNLSPALAPVFGVEPGTIVGPTPTNFGWLLILRER